MVNEDRGLQNLDDSHSFIMEFEELSDSVIEGKGISSRGGLLTYVKNQMINSKLVAIVTITSIAFSIGFIGMLITSIYVLPSIFLRLTENSVGSTDFIIVKDLQSFKKSSSLSDIPFANKIGSVLVDTEYLINQTQVLKSIRGAVPRSIFPGFIKKFDRKVNCILMVGDSQKEIKSRVGHLADLQPLVEDEVYLSRDVMVDLDIQVGERFVLTLPWMLALKEKMGFSSMTNQEFLNRIAQESKLYRKTNYSIPFEKILDGLSTDDEITIELTAKLSIDDPMGKWPKPLGNVVFMDQKYLTKRLIQKFDAYFEEIYNREIDKALDSANVSLSERFVSQLFFATLKVTLMPIVRNIINLEKYSMSMNYIVEDKLEVYGDFKDFEKKLSRIADEIKGDLEEANGYKVITLPKEGYAKLGLIAIFVKNLIYCIIMMLCIVCYNVLSAVAALDIHEKTYQLGMLRALGATRYYLYVSILVANFIYSLIGVALGLGIERLGAILVSDFTKNITNYDSDVSLTWGRFFFMVFLAFILPTITTLNNTSKAFLSTLVQSLSHNASELPKVIYTRLSDYSFSAGTIFLGLEVFIFGFTFYFIAPILFARREMDILLFILTCVLIAGVVGSSVLGGIVRAKVQNIGLELVARITNVNWVVKLISKKAGSMSRIWLIISFSVCFIMFTGSGIASFVKYLKGFVVVLNGADLVVSQEGSRYLLERNFTSLLSEKQMKGEGVDQFSFVSTQLNSIGYTTIYIQGSPFQINPGVYGIERNYMETIDTGFYEPGEFVGGKEYPKIEESVWIQKKDGVSSVFEKSIDIHKVRDPYKILDDNQGGDLRLKLFNIVLPTGIMNSFGAEIGEIYSMRFNCKGRDFHYKVRLTHTANKIPGFWFSSYETLLKIKLQALISVESFSVILKDVRDSYFGGSTKMTSEQMNSILPFYTPEAQTSDLEVPKEKLLIKLSSKITERQKIKLKNELRLLMASEDLMLDRESIESDLEILNYILSWLNLAVSVIFSILALFLLLIGNIRRVEDNAQEIGMIRSIGLSSQNLSKLLKIEMLVGLGSAILVGTFLGLFLSLVGVGAFSAFFEAKIMFHFPGFNFIFLLVLLILSGYIAATIAFYKLKRTNIVELLKGNL